MKIPKTLKIQGHDYEIILRNRTKEDGQTDFGTHGIKEGKIWINTDCVKSQQESTLIHELLEALSNLNDLGLTHQQISALETGLYQIFKDNSMLK